MKLVIKLVNRSFLKLRCESAAITCDQECTYMGRYILYDIKNKQDNDNRTRRSSITLSLIYNQAETALDLKQ